MGHESKKQAWGGWRAQEGLGVGQKGGEENQQKQILFENVIIELGVMIMNPKNIKYKNI